MWAQITTAIFGVVIAAAVFVTPVDAHTSGIHTISVSDIIGDDAKTYPLGIVCDDTILIYGISLSIPYNDHADRYAIYANSIRLADDTIPHDPFTSGNDHVRIDITDILGAGGMTYPISLGPYTPLVVPIQVLNSGKDNLSVSRLDITYVSSSSTNCKATELHGAQKVGLIIPIKDDPTGVGEAVLAATQTAIDKYNMRLDDMGASWYMELVIKDDMAIPSQSRERAQELCDESISATLGAVDDTTLSAISEHTGMCEMVVISCCSTDVSLASRDHVFRTIPDYTNQAKVLAAMMHDAQIHVAITVHADDSHSANINQALKQEMESRGAIVGATILYPTDREAYDYGIAAAQLNQELKAFGDVNGAEHVAVVAISSLGVIDLILASLSHDTLDDHRWYVSEDIVGMAGMTEGDIGEFAQTVRLSGPAPHLMPDTPDTFWHLAYNAAMILSESMAAAQSQDARDIMQAIPYVSARTYGMLNQDGDLADSDYDIWAVTGDGWKNVGRYLHHGMMLEG